MLIKTGTEVRLYSFSIHHLSSFHSDLVIGAYESQSVFVLRTIPVAITNISITFSTEQVMLQDYDCVYQGNPVAWYIIYIMHN